MTGHVSPIIANSWLRHTRREIEVEDQEHEVRFAQATSTPAGRATFWASCRREMRGVEFRLVGREEEYKFWRGILTQTRPIRKNEENRE